MNDDRCEGEQERADSARVRFEGVALEKCVENDRGIGTVGIRRVKGRDRSSVRSVGGTESRKKRIVPAAVRFAMIVEGSRRTRNITFALRIGGYRGREERFWLLSRNSAETLIIELEIEIDITHWVREIIPKHLEEAFGHRAL